MGALSLIWASEGPPLSDETARRDLETLRRLSTLKPEESADDRARQLTDAERSEFMRALVSVYTWEQQAHALRGANVQR
jgi:hypothetical protein